MYLIGRKFKLIDERAGGFHNCIYELVKINNTAVELQNRTQTGSWSGPRTVKDANDISYAEFKSMWVGYKVGHVCGREIKPW